MKVLTRPLLDHFGIHYFHFHQVKENGELFYICNQIGMNEFIYSQKEFVENNPYTVSPSKLKEGIFDFDLNRFPLIDEASLILRKELKVQKLISIVSKNSTGYVACSFGFPRGNLFLTNLLGRDSYLLYHYLSYFIDEIDPLLKKSLDNAVDLRLAMGNNFHNPRCKLVGSPIKREQFFNSLNKRGKKVLFAPNFTEKEIECLKLCFDGLTAAQIGEKLFRSKRTIEHRLDQIKAKIGCNRKSEIIPFLRRLGYWRPENF